MELDRRSIERDFPTSRRGYDPAEVRVHLREIADQVEELAWRQDSAPVAASAASQVRSIVEAAERSGVELESTARKEADRIRAEADRIRAAAETEAEEARARTSAEATKRLELVHAASARVLARAEAIERALAELRDEALALGSELGVDAPPEADPLEEPEPDDVALTETAPDTAAPTVDGYAEELTPEADEEREEPKATRKPTGDRTARAPAGDRIAGGPDVEDVRLVALNMALNGSPREETARYLEENFAVEDPGPLLDEVYARAGS